MTRRVLLALVMALAAMPAIAQPRIAIFVGPNTREGFVDVDQGVLDSIKDIQNELIHTKRFTLARTADAATLTLTVVGRGTTGNNGAVGVPIGTMTVMMPVKRQAISTILRRGTYERPMTSADENSDAWRASAKQVARDVVAWVDANRSMLP